MSGRNSGQHFPQQQHSAVTHTVCPDQCLPHSSLCAWTPKLWSPILIWTVLQEYSRMLKKYKYMSEHCQNSFKTFYMATLTTSWYNTFRMAECNIQHVKYYTTKTFSLIKCFNWFDHFKLASNTIYQTNLGSNVCWQIVKEGRSSFYAQETPQNLC